MDKWRMPIYKNKFLTIIVIATMATVAVFLCIASHYKKSLDVIVDNHSKYTSQMIASLPNVKLTKDSCYYLDDRLVADVEMHMEDVETMMKIQSNKIQSDFTLLSVWAGILMIVFLIFSIYSMFKTDEMVKQGREALKTIEDAKVHANEEVNKIDEIVRKEIAKVQQTANEEIKKLSEKTDGAIKQVNAEMENSRQEFDKIVEDKVKMFEKVRDDYVKRLKQADNKTSDLFQQMRDIFMNQFETEKMDQSTQEDENGKK